MPDPAEPYGPRRRSIMPVLLLMLVMVLVGMGGMAWLFHRFDSVSRLVKPAPPVALAPAPLRVPAPVRVVPPPAVVETIVDERIDKIEDKVEDIGERAERATSEAHRAEGLLVAFAARRAIDRGTSLGYLEGVLRERFGRVEPQSVATVISASRQPVTIGQLRDQLDAIAPQLSSGSSGEGWLQDFRRELAGLIIIRSADTPSAAPVDRVGRAREELAAGHVDGALAEVARLPARAVAQGWIANARRYVQARAALDRIESAALLQRPVAAE